MCFPVIVWALGQLVAAGHVAWVAGPRAAIALFGHDPWVILGGIAGVFVLIVLITVVPVWLRGLQHSLITGSWFVILWLWLVMAGAGWLAWEYGSLIGEQLLPPEYRSLGPTLTWMVTCLVLGLPAAWLDFGRDLPPAPVFRSITVWMPVVVRRRIG